MLTSLDKELSGVLRPLVELGAVIRVSQFPNSLCLGFHYLLAHGDGGRLPKEGVVPSGRIDLADWNFPRETLQRDKKHFNGIYLLYQPKGLAKNLCSQQMDSQSFFSSVPVTRFRPRYAFLLSTPESREVVSRSNGKLNKAVFDDLIARQVRVNFQTDVTEQAKELVGLLATGDQSERIRFVGAGWPIGTAVDDEQITLLYYGATITAYMRQNADIFLALEIDDSLVADSPAFETHVLWTVPRTLADRSGVVRQCISQYHELLFGASAERRSSHLFAATRAACNEVLGRFNPGIPHRVLANVDAFRTVLQDHHSSPN